MTFGLEELKFQNQALQSRLMFQILHQKMTENANKVSIFRTYFS